MPLEKEVEVIPEFYLPQSTDQLRCFVYHRFVPKFATALLPLTELPFHWAKEHLVFATPVIYQRPDGEISLTADASQTAIYQVL